MWHEGVASRGSNEVASCILKYLQNSGTCATNLVTFSDSCGGQNRNVNMLCMWLHVVDSDDYSYTTVDQKFMTVGHSYLPNDRDFGSIETARLKANHIYVPQDWCNLVLNCRRNNPFRVSAMTQEDFVSLEPVAKCIVNRKLNTFKQKVEWLNMKWIRITKGKPLQFQYRYTLNELENSRPTEEG